ncbi:unnamed protein product [Vicia faba]|uniref:5'-deoxynucleotidase n=1 Tax=Vicia faba TaxID=3906 RepID=A0AAV1APL6_VICFA|nr:unnamed protein product [Vicia faba]
MANAPSSSSPSSPATAPSSSSPSLPVTAPSSSSPSSPVTASTNTTPPPSSSSVVPDAPPSPKSAVDFLSLCHKLKARKGTTRWLRSDVENPESLADHMYGMTLMALIAPDVPGLDRNKCIKMAIIHDTAEVMILDTTPYVRREITHQRGQVALYNMCRILGEGEGSRGKEITELWMDYEANSSPEAKFVKDLDKVEMILQALNYKGDEQGNDLDEFLRSTAGEFQTEIGKAWATEIVSRRKNT